MLTVFALPLALAALTVGEAPEARFAVKGRVLDVSGAPIAQARVTATSADPRSTPATATDSSGAFTLVLPPGTHSLKAVAPGFLESSQELTALADGGDTREFVLKVAPFGETVTVRAAGDYQVESISSGTKTLTPLRDLPQSITVTTKELIRDQLMLSVGDVMRYTPGIQVHQGENNRDQVIIRGNSSSADFFLNGVRDDVQYYRDLYNLDRIEALKGPNAMTFGRGGGGGVVNRVTKEADFQPYREAIVQAGGYSHKRIAADFDQPLNDKVAFRLNGMYENSDSFRQDVDLERYGINPTMTVAASASTRVTLGYEHLHDTRVADRGITSYQGSPADVDVSTYYGNPADSHVRAGVDLGTATIEHKAGNLIVRNRTMYGAYDRFYQNYVPGAVTADKSLVALTAYNNATQRDNVFNQTDLIYRAATGSVKHTLLGGVELGRQSTDNFRNTGYFNNSTTSLSVPYAAPTISTPVTFRQSATDADNHLKTNVAAAYVQDQLEVAPKLQLLGGLRFDRFDLTYHNNRNDDTLSRVDDLLSPRAGVVYKPVLPVSVYGSYTVSYLPSSGDQFSSLTAITEQVKPEKFTNYELGVKWEPRPGVDLTAAVYRLDRTNTRATDPNDPTRIVQTGSQRTSGVEIGLGGRVTSAWRIAGGYAYQDGFVTSATIAAKAGATSAQVPHHTLSLWNHYQFLPRLGAAVGILFRTDMFATIDNTVTLPGYTRLDVAAFYALTKDLRLQANLENALDEKYWLNADSNTNLSPGFGRVLRVGLSARF
ncbi:MAG TPA: TonB-dependent siderophore receptor [Vicinamibacteria bacterium]|nr:TonB-dependent siderophore receptor [Vicinamibacteria bacterium]